MQILSKFGWQIILKIGTPRLLPSNVHSFDNVQQIISIISTICRFFLIYHKSMDLPWVASQQPRQRRRPVTCIWTRFMIRFLVIARLEQTRDTTSQVSSILRFKWWARSRHACQRMAEMFKSCFKNLYEQSHAELLSSYIVHDQLLAAEWKMQFLLRLRWRPQLPELTGQTLYHFDKNNLVYIHENTRGISPGEAFLKTFSHNFHISYILKTAHNHFVSTGNLTSLNTAFHWKSPSARDYQRFS